MHRLGLNVLWAAAAAISTLTASPHQAAAACVKMTLEEKSPQLIETLKNKLRAAGVSDVTDAGQVGPNQEAYALKGTSVVMMVTEVAQGLRNVTVNTVGSSSPKDFAAAAAVAAYVLTRFSGTPEDQVREKLDASLSAHASEGSWEESWASTYAKLSRSADKNIGIQIGKLECN